MPEAARFTGGPLDGEVFFMPRAPDVLYARRSVDTQGIVHVPDSHEPPMILRGGSYTRTVIESSGEIVYRFEE